mmetsp:Transcript_25688/g.41418  ORF Transcript_25688/g.41418 Transcript_25688/m.41418 type:complete len:909 (+) Transcript_25688:3-2729(+)
MDELWGDGGGEDDVFQWLINESNTSGPVSEERFPPDYLKQQTFTSSGQMSSVPAGENESRYAYGGGTFTPPQSQASVQGDEFSEEGFGWADSLLTEGSPLMHAPHSPYIEPLTDDLDGAFDVVMSGGQTGTPGVTPAMHEFATEAASGSRRRNPGYNYQTEQAALLQQPPPPPQSYRETPMYAETKRQQYMVARPLRDHEYDDEEDEDDFEELSNHKKRGLVVKSKNLKGGKSQMSPRSQAQREKNRQAVRNCRKRKREYAEKLKDREKLLQEENEKLRLQLKLGSEEMQSNMKIQCEQLASSMTTALREKTGDRQVFAAATKKYVQTHAAQGKNREGAIKHIISRLIRQVEPTHVTKMYLWQSAQDSSYFRTPGGLWEQLNKRLELTVEQGKTLRARCPTVVEMCKDIASVLDKLDRMHTMIIKKQRLSTQCALFNNIADILDEKQLATFIAFVHQFNWTPDLEEKWNTYQASFDKELDEEALNKTGDWIVHNPGQSVLPNNGHQPPERKSMKARTSDTTVLPAIGQKECHFDDVAEEALLRNRHKSAIVLKECFERPESELQEYVKTAFADNIDLYDPNTVRVIRGTEQVLLYVKRIRTSFSGLVVKEENFMTRKNLARGRWTLTGTYYGVMGTIGKRGGGEALLPSIPQNAPGNKREGKQVSFKVIIAYKFVPGSAQIQQLMVSWAALDVMKQLGLLPEAFDKPLGERMKAQKDMEKRRQVRNQEDPSNDLSTSLGSPNLVGVVPKLDQKLKERKCVELTKIFQADLPEERVEIASELLDDQCIFHDSNMGGDFSGPEACVDYIRRLRRPFSTMIMTKHNFVSINKRKKGPKKKQTDQEETTKVSRTQMGCLVKGTYSGALVDKPKPYEFNATIFVIFNQDNNKILEVEMSWNASSLMRQLGVLH